MADEADIPPLEDMTGLLQKAELIREQRDGKDNTKGLEEAKKRAKVTKKTSQSTNKTCQLGDEHKVETSTSTQQIVESTANTQVVETCTKSKSSDKTQNDIFGGMKKGFLFGGGGSKKPSSTNKAKATTTGSKVKDEKKDDIPFIAPSSKTESGLTFNEVQEAMSEAKGLLNNQEWITEDFLNKIEKNDTLLKRFSDAQFMNALQEFQTNPQAAMAKYKGNTEVEAFLMEFCGLLGDHFTNFADGDKNKESSKKPTSQSQSEPAPKPVVKDSTSTSKGPKIIEIGKEEDSNNDKQNITTNVKTNTPSAKSNPKVNQGSIRVLDPQNEADIQEVKPQSSVPQQMADDEVKAVLDDPKVMETLMDPNVMALIKTLREDPEKAQKLIDSADKGLKQKVQLLVSKGLLQFQTS